MRSRVLVGPLRARVGVWALARQDDFLEGLSAYKQKEDGVNNRSVMPFDVLGRTRATMIGTASLSDLPAMAGPSLT